jgi:polyhydroxyalkanoate synthesis repressor PhaR
MVKTGEEFVVYDAKTNEDLTRQILTQIIFEQESRGEHVLPVNFLRSVIAFYGNKMQELLPHYLEASMESFKHNQDTMREYVGQTMQEMDKVTPMNQFEEIGRQNMELFQQAFTMFNPFGFGAGEAKKAGKK